jgi:hypothetical protein
MNANQDVPFHASSRTALPLYKPQIFVDLGIKKTLMYVRNEMNVSIERREG